MKPIPKLLAVFALILATFSQPLNVSAADIFKFRGHSASAFFSSIDPSGCVNTGGSVFVFEDLSHSPPGRGTSSSAILIDLFQFNFCTGEGLLSASGSADLAASAFQVAGNLGSASVHATVPLFDFASNTAFDVTVDLTWTSTSSLGHQSSHINVSFEGCHVNLKNNSAFRFAEASGSISDGTTDFVPSPSSQATIFSAKGGEISHGCT